MRRVLLTALWLGLAATAHAVPPSHEATLTFASGAQCTGEWYWSDNPHYRLFWTGGAQCSVTFNECNRATVTDIDGVHNVKACSPDSDNSRGRKAAYRP